MAATDVVRSPGGSCRSHNIHPQRWYWRNINKVSNNYVAFDSDGYNRLPSGALAQIQEPLMGWTPVRLRNGDRGWIASRYVYDEENDDRVSFVRSRG